MFDRVNQYKLYRLVCLVCFAALLVAWLVEFDSGVPRTPDAPERRWLRVAIYAYEVRKEIFPPGDEGHKKTRFRGLCSGRVYLPITGE